MLRWICLLALLGLATPAAAQNCDDPQDQQSMNHCAWLAYEAADRELNAVYRRTRAFLGEIDADMPEAMQGGPEALRDAQRAWIIFRDKACEAEGFLFRGGTMEPLIVSSCKTGLTRRRIADMRRIME